MERWSYNSQDSEEWMAREGQNGLQRNMEFMESPRPDKEEQTQKLENEAGKLQHWKGLEGFFMREKKLYFLPCFLMFSHSFLNETRLM